MNGSKTWKLVLLLGGIFLGGMVVGGALTLHFGQQFIQRRTNPEQWGPERLRMLARHLDLSPGQMEQLRPVVHRNMSELAELRQDAFRETRRVLERLEQEIAAVLTPEQKVKFKELNEELRERARRQMERRRQERERRGPGAEGPPHGGRP